MTLFSFSQVLMTFFKFGFHCFLQLDAQTMSTSWSLDIFNGPFYIDSPTGPGKNFNSLIQVFFCHITAQGCWR
jgi:hypothetical protein